MKDYIKEHFACTTWGRARTALTCADGSRLSVQASGGHYCTPKVDQEHVDDTYTHVEVWCWPKGTRTFSKWANCGPAGWVPVEVVNRWVHRHGGLA